MRESSPRQSEEYWLYRGSGGGGWIALAVIIVIVVTVGLPCLHIAVIYLLDKDFVGNSTGGSSSHHNGILAIATHVSVDDDGNNTVGRLAIRPTASVMSVLSETSKRYSNKLFRRARIVFKPLLEDYKPDSQWFGLVVHAKNISVALCLVFISDSLQQSILLMVVYWVYSIALSVQPYTDLVPFVMDITITRIDAITLVVPVLYVTNRPVMVEHSTELGWVLLTLQVISIAAYTGERVSESQAPWMMGLMIGHRIYFLMVICVIL